MSDIMYFKMYTSDEISQQIIYPKKDWKLTNLILFYYINDR